MVQVPRRRLLQAAGALGAAGITGAAAGCAPPVRDSLTSTELLPPADGKVHLTYWAWADKMQGVADIFNAQQDRIEVEFVWIPAGRSGGNAKTLSAVAAGGGPDIAQVELRSISEFVLAGALTDLAPYGLLEEQNRFNPSAFEQVVLGEGAWGVPQDMGPCAMFYNRAVLEGEMGIPAPASWEEFRDVSAEVATAGKSMLALNPNDGVVIPMWMMQAGASWFRPSPEGWTVSMTDDTSLQVAEFWDGMLRSGDLITSYGTGATPWMTAAGAGNVLGHIGGSWSDGIIKNIPGGEGRWAVAPMPRWDSGFASGQNGGSGAGILATSEHPHEALEFLLWMCGTPEGVDAMIDIQNIGWSPLADYIGATRNEPDPYYDQPAEYPVVNTDVIAPMAADQNLDWVWPPLTQRFLALLGDGMVDVVNGETTLVDFLPEAEQEITRVMRSKGLDVEVQR